MDECADTVVETLRKSLSSLTGEIAYYRVEVKIDTETQNKRPGEDVRQVVGLVQLDDDIYKKLDEGVNEKDNPYSPSCLFSEAQ